MTANSKDPQTIHDLLQQTVKGKVFGEGENFELFEVPKTDYLLRVYRHPLEDTNGRRLSGFSDFLANTTSLTPVHLFSENVGQPLLNGHSDSFSITKKVPGKALNAVLFEYVSSAQKMGMDYGQATCEGYKKLLDELSNLPDEKWCDFIRHIQRLTAQGLTVDFLAKNIIYDQKTQALSMIDTGYATYNAGHENESDAIASVAALNDWRTNIEQLLHYDFKPGYIGWSAAQAESICQALAPYRDRLAAKAAHCATLVDGPKTAEEILSAHKAGKIHIKRLDKISAPVVGVELSLKDTPKVLVEKLRSIEDHSFGHNIPVR